MLRSRFFWKIFLSVLGTILVTTLTIIYMMSLHTEEIVERETVNNLSDKLALAIPLLEAHFQQDRAASLGPEALKIAALVATRVTFVDANGLVLAETEKPAEQLTNHLDRPEIKQAMAGEIGVAKRKSTTTGLNMLYVARQLTLQGKVFYIRLSIPTDAIQERWAMTANIIFGGILVGCVLAILASFFLAKRITGPISDITDVAGAISRGNYDARVMRLPRNELGSLGQAINVLATAVQENINRREQVEKIRREFSSNASHELKTPLTSIRGYVETLLAGAIHDSDNNIRFLDIILANINRMISLVNDLLRISSIEANADLLELSPVDWVPVIEEVLARHRIQMETKKIEIILDLCPDRFKIRGNSKAMSHILDNLLQNAINYTQENGSIAIKLRHDEADGTLSVIDTGIGIAEGDQARIFERFYRVDSARSRADGGTGLGLAIVKHLVLQLHGKIMVQSELGKGSTFSVVLPLHLRRNKPPSPTSSGYFALTESVS